MLFIDNNNNNTLNYGSIYCLIESELNIPISGIDILEEKLLSELKYNKYVPLNNKEYILLINNNNIYEIYKVNVDAGYVWNSVKYVNVGTYEVLQKEMNNNNNNNNNNLDNDEIITELDCDKNYNKNLIEKNKQNIVKLVNVANLGILSIFPNLREIQFNCYFNKPLEVGVIPSGVTHLNFGHYFNQPLKAGVIPSSVTHLTFGNKFNQPLKAGVIPPNVTHLSLGSCFDQPLKSGVIPSNVTHFTFRHTFNQPLKSGVISRM